MAERNYRYFLNSHFHSQNASFFHLELDFQNMRNFDYDDFNLLDESIPGADRFILREVAKYLLLGIVLKV